MRQMGYSVCWQSRPSHRPTMAPPSTVPSSMAPLIATHSQSRSISQSVQIEDQWRVQEVLQSRLPHLPDSGASWGLVGKHHFLPKGLGVHKAFCRGFSVVGRQDSSGGRASDYRSYICEFEFRNWQNDWRSLFLDAPVFEITLIVDK